MSRPVRTTIVYAIFSGIAVVPAALLLSPTFGWTTALKSVLWADLALYAVMMARWSRAGLLPVLLPLVLLLGAALWPGTYSGFFVLALGVFAWIRSGVCFPGAPLRALTAEVITLVGGSGLLLFFGAHSSLAGALNICLFYLIQSLYFFIVPTGQHRFRRTDRRDPFEQAAEEARKVMDGV